GAALQHLGEVDAVALATRQLADLLLLIGAPEVERRAVGAGIHLALAELDDVEAARQLLPYGLVGIECLATLVDIAQRHRWADREGPGVGLFLAGDHLEERRFARAVGADHAHDAAWRQAEGEVVDQQAITEALGDLVRLDDVIAQPGPRGDHDLLRVEGRLLLLLDHLVVGGDARLALGAPRRRAGAHPFELALHGAPSGVSSLFFLRQPL